jgi:ABC-type Fe3+ transport system permease subunit
VRCQALLTHAPREQQDLQLDVERSTFLIAAHCQIRQWRRIAIGAFRLRRTERRERLKALIRVVVPIIASGMAVVALFAFIATWNEFLFAVVLTGIETKTMMVLVTSYTSGGTDMFYGEASASVVLGVLPAFVVAFLLQRYLVKGLALGGTKG